MRDAPERVAAHASSPTEDGSRTKIAVAKTAAAAKRTPESARLGIHGCFTLILTRLARVHVTSAHIRERSYPPQGSLPLHDIDAAQAEFQYRLQREDSAHTDDKVKQLLTLSSALASVVVVFTGDVQPRLIVAIPMGLLLASVFLCLGALGVRTINAPTLEDMRRSDIKQQWAKDLLSSCFANRGRHAFRVDCYRAAARYFVLALLGTPVILFFSVPKPNPALESVRAIEKLEGVLSLQSEVLLESLRGTASAPTDQPRTVNGTATDQPVSAPIIKPGDSNAEPDIRTNRTP